MFQQFQMEAKEVAFCFHPSMASASWISAPVIQPSNPCVKDWRSLYPRGVSMTDFTLNQAIDGATGGPIQPASRPNLDKGFNPLTMIIFFGILAAGLLFVAYSIYSDVNATGTKVTSCLPYILLLVALLIALGFEFVNGFQDTANAVATVIYTHSLPAEFAVMWSGFFNFLGVLLSSGAVAFGIVSLLPVELILQVGSSAGFAMVFALLIAAILWNLGTWYFGPAGIELPHSDRLHYRRRRG
jgi:PiT family inorganic phosphate transporter